MEASPPQQGPSKRLCREEEPPIDDVNILEQIPPQDPVNDLTIENMAFSQYPIIKNVFRFLNPDDLENCWGVSRHWKEVAETFVSVHYDILMSHFSNPEQVILVKRARFNRGNLKRYKLDLEDAIKTLEEALITHNGMVVLDLANLGLDSDLDDRTVEDFLLKLGPLVQHLSFSSKYEVQLNGICHFLLTYFPNLKSLDCSSLKLMKDSMDFEDFNPELPEQQLKKLKKIKFGPKFNYDFETFVKLLKIGPNLEEILDLPVWCVNALVIADKVQALKTVTYNLGDFARLAQNGLTTVSAFKKLSELRPKLSSFSTELLTCWHMEKLKPFMLSILQSSAESLRTFEMRLTVKGGFENTPQLKGVKTLVFYNPYDDSGRYFSAGISLGEIYPNANEIRFTIESWETSINQDLPEIKNSSWGSQIKRLEFRELPLNSLPTVRSLFPLIGDLEFKASANEIPELFRAFPKFCPHLKSMTIVVGTMFDQGELNSSMELDCAFSGLSSDVVAQLLDPSQRGVFSDDQIEGFKSQSPILKLTALRRLTLTLCVASPTHVSYEFGFRLLPHLKVSVTQYKIWQN